jgi:hypothetical protein
MRYALFQNDAVLQWRLVALRFAPLVVITANFR